MTDEFPGWRDGNQGHEHPISKIMTVAVTRTVDEALRVQISAPPLPYTGVSGEGRVPARVRLERGTGPRARTEADHEPDRHAAERLDAATTSVGRPPRVRTKQEDQERARRAR